LPAGFRPAGTILSILFILSDVLFIFTLIGCGSAALGISRLS